MGRYSFILCVSLSLTQVAAYSQPAQTPVLHIQADEATAAVSPLFSGMMTEEINHAYDGGLYGELIQNRVFKDDAARPVHWSLAQEGATASMALDDTNGLNENLGTSLRLEVGSLAPGARAGIANEGYWGIPVKPRTVYHASFYAKAAAGFDGPVTVSIETTNGATVFASAEVGRLSGDWRKYSVTLKTPRKIAPTADARFVLTIGSAGTVWFDLVSLFPPTWHDRPNGNRVDLMRELAEMRPRFLRFPGGNFLEGDSITNRFPWKQTLGDLAERPGHPGCWGYRASDGLGLLEFLEWAEDLKAEPVLAVYAGYSLAPKSELIQPGADLAPYVADALDEIEYVMGDTNTKWGARRAADGHPAPFKLTYVEIGNEDWFDGTRSYDGRFAQFFDAIKAKYPQLQCISTVGNEQPAEKRVHSRKPDVVDEHYYWSEAGFAQEAPSRFEKYDRNGPKIFVGEWAAYEDVVPWDEKSQHLPPTPSLKAALGDAVWMAAMERNSDLIVMQCYAPMLVNVNPGGRQWRPNLIGYDALRCFGSPSYYANAMFNANRGDVVVRTSGEGLNQGKTAALDYSVTKDSAHGILYIKVVNVTGEPQPLRLEVAGVKRVISHGTAVVLTSAEETDTNSLSDPVKVAPVTEKIEGLAPSFTRTFPPYSITVLKIQTK